MTIGGSLHRTSAGRCEPTINQTEQDHDRNYDSIFQYRCIALDAWSTGGIREEWANAA